jgi:putative copper resistance protein D
MIELAGLVVARFVHFGALTFLFGAGWAPAYANLESIAPRVRSMQRIASWLALLSGLAWFLFALGGMAGSLSAAFDPSLILSTIREVSFGQVSAARLIGCLVLVHLLHLGGIHGARWPAWVLSGALLASIALTGHAQAEEGQAQLVHTVSDGLHLLAAGLWLGALSVFGLLFQTRTGASEEVQRTALGQFSSTGIVAVLVLIATGLVNSFFLVGTPVALVAGPYGWLLTVKLVLFVAMLALAALNRRDLRNAMPTATLRRRLIIEQGCGAAVLAVVACLGTVMPAAMAT